MVFETCAVKTEPTIRVRALGTNPLHGNEDTDSDGFSNIE